ncbi:MAG: bifunctional cytochrome P450/NADPH--P450 reductase [Aureispira sp.]
MNIPIPQNRPLPLLGNLLELNLKEGMLVNLEKLAQTKGELYRLKLPSSSILVASSYSIINEICDEKRFQKAVTPPLLNIRDFTKDGLFTAYNDEPNWIKAHRILTPTFGPMSIRGMFPEMLDVAEQLVLKWERMGAETRFDVADDMTRLTLDTIALCAFNYRFNSFYRDEMHPFVHSMVEGLIEAGEKNRRLPFQGDLMFWNRKKYENNIDYMNRVADAIIEKRKENSEGKFDDLLGKMLSSKDPITGEGLSDENIRYQMITFLIAGHETTSGLLSFTLYYLCKHPEVLAKAEEEVKRVLGNKKPEVGHINKLSYLDQILKETLRLKPTAPVFGIEPLEDTVIGGQYAVKKGETILVLIPELHKDPTIWGTEAEAFQPERFAKENFSQMPPNSWKPFGNGARACIGRPFAMQEAILVLAMILQRFDIQLADPNYELQVKETLTIKPEGFYLKAKRKDIVIEEEGGTNVLATINDQEEALEAVDDPQLLILFGSNSGSCRSFALQLAQDATKKGVRAKVGVLDDYVATLPKDSKLIIITASYEGQPTNNAKHFVDWLKETNEAEFNGLEYCVFGCGNSDWFNTYQAIPTLIDKRLEVLGAQRFFEKGAADAKEDFLGDWETWEEKLWQHLEQILEVSKEDKESTSPLAVEIINAPLKLQHLKQKQLQQGRILVNRALVDTTQELGRPKQHLDIELPNGMSYRAGDYLSILPVNTTDNIQRVLEYFSLEATTQLVLKDNAAVSMLPLDYPISVGELLKNYVELGQAITRRQLEVLVKNTPCPPERVQLEKWCQKEIYTQEVLKKNISLIDVLQRMGSCSISFGDFLSMLPPLQIRQYSISSSPFVNYKRCSLTVAVVNGAAWSGQGIHQGVASTYLSTLQVGETVWLEVVPSKEAFHLPKNSTAPIIMIGAGSGLAPFRGFIQERVAQGDEGKMLLFFGCDHPDVDFLYQEELMAWQKQSNLEIFPAFTYQEVDGVKFVQHQVWKERAAIWAALEQGATIYVCGNGEHMAPAVKETLIEICAEKKNSSKEEAILYVEELQKNNRYVLDVF